MGDILDETVDYLRIASHIVATSEEGVCIQL